MISWKNTATQDQAPHIIAEPTAENPKNISNRQKDKPPAPNIPAEKQKVTSSFFIVIVHRICDRLEYLLDLGRTKKILFY